MKRHTHTGAVLSDTTCFNLDRPVMAIVVDTEEEFDWDAPFDRNARAVTNIQEQYRVHDVIDKLGTKLTYCIDQAVVDDDKASDTLMALRDHHSAEIGAHLHPWLSAPFEEDINNFNSFHGNLPADLERAKMKTLRDTICERFGAAPISFKAGRYGLGPNSFEALKDLGFKVDCSVLPFTTHKAKDGADFIGLPDVPFWADSDRELLCVPLTRGFTGIAPPLGEIGPRLFDSPLAGRTKIPAILSHSNLTKRITLTPEGMNSTDMINLIKRLTKRGGQVFSLAYHSSSLGIGHTSYVRDAADRRTFLDTLQDVLSYFKNELGGTFVTLTDIYQMAQDAAPNTSNEGRT